MEDLKQIQEFFSKPLKEGTFDQGEIAIYIGHDDSGTTHIFKRGKGYYGYNDEFDFEAASKEELQQKLDKWGYELLAGSLEENRKLTYNDFVRMVRDDMMAGAAPDERPSEELVGKRAKAYYNEYLQGASVDDLFEAVNEISKEDAWKEYQEKRHVTDKTASVARKDFDKGWDEGKFRDGNYMSMEEAETPVSEDIPDIIAVDVPLFIRLLEFAREDAGDDMDLHEVAERAIEAVKARGVLSMDDYDTLIPPKEELDEALIVTKDKIDRLARQVAAHISKQKNTRDAQEFLRKAIEDAYAKVFDADEYEIKENALGFSDVAKFGKEAESKIDNAVRGDSRYTFGNDPYADDQLRYEYAKKFGYVNEAEGYSKFLEDDPEHPGGKTKGLTPDVMNKILMKIVQDIDETKQLGEGVIEEDLCPKGKAYIKKRMAAGEKSSAYLSGRAVKVCKGQMKG